MRNTRVEGIVIRHVVIAGAGIGGLGAALGFSRAGHRVTLIERESPPPTDDPEEAFFEWRRSSVPQGPQPHSVIARSRNLLLARAPEIVAELDAFGARWNLIENGHSDSTTADDDRFTGYLVRRLCFESILRRCALRDRAVDMRSNAIVEDIEIDAGASDVPTVTGVRLRDGEMIAADLVIDACGRRTPIPSVLKTRGIALPVEINECNTVYYSRYMRRIGDIDPDEDLFLSRVSVIGGDLGYLAFSLAFGDHRTIGCWLVAPPWDQELKILRRMSAWDAAVRSIPDIAVWGDPGRCVPLTDVMPMGGHQNLRRCFISSDRPLVLGLLPIGDALCTTNPFYGWGISIALTHAFAAVDAFGAGNGHDDVAIAYDKAVADETDAYFRASSDMDRLRSTRWRGDQMPDEDREIYERIKLLRFGLQPAGLRDVYVARAMARRQSMVDQPNAIWSDERAISVARRFAEEQRASGGPTAPAGPTREELLEIMKAAR